MSKDDGKPWYEDIKDRFKDLGEDVEDVKDRQSKIENNVSYMRGELDEMKRHNGKVMKFLMGVVVVLLAIIGALIGLKIPGVF